MAKASKEAETPQTPRGLAISAALKKHYRETPDAREVTSRAMKKYFEDTPKAKEALSQAAKKEWEDSDYREQHLPHIRSLADSFWHDPEYEEKRKRRNENSAKANKERGTTQKKILPLALRGANREEISMIYPDLSKDQIRTGIRGIKDVAPSVNLTKEEISLMHQQAALTRYGKKKDPYTAKQHKGFSFARMLIDSGFIGVDLSLWDRLIESYQSHQRKLPKNFADRLRLEALLFAYTQQHTGNHEFLEQYSNLGTTLGPRWFAKSLAEEEIFISEIFDSSLELEHNLPKPFNEYSELAQQTIKMIDTLSIPLKTKISFFCYWVFYVISYRQLSDMAKDIGIDEKTLDEYMRTVWKLDDKSKEWPLLEKIIEDNSPQEWVLERSPLKLYKKNKLPKTGQVFPPKK